MLNYVLQIYYHRCEYTIKLQGRSCKQTITKGCVATHTNLFLWLFLVALVINLFLTIMHNHEVLTVKLEASFLSNGLLCIHSITYIIEMFHLVTNVQQMKWLLL